MSFILSPISFVVISLLNTYLERLLERNTKRMKVNWAFCAWQNASLRLKDPHLHDLDGIYAYWTPNIVICNMISLQPLSRALFAVLRRQGSQPTKGDCTKLYRMGFLTIRGMYSATCWSFKNDVGRILVYFLSRGRRSPRRWNNAAKPRSRIGEIPKPNQMDSLTTGEFQLNPV